MTPPYDPVVTPRVSAAEFGSLAVEGPTEIEAGAYASWKIVYTAGSRGIAPGGGISIFTECDSDWEKPQTIDPDGDAFVSASAPSGVVVFTNIPDQNTIRLSVASGTLAPGAVVSISLGDRSFGSRGTRTQTFYESRRYFLCEVDTDGSGDGKVLETQPSVNITGGDLAVLDVVAPPDVDTSSEFTIYVKASDAWGNPAQHFTGTVRVAAAGIALPVESVEFDNLQTGIVEISGCRVSEPGVLRITATHEDNDVVGVSNPVNATELPAEQRLFWGDPHSGQVADAQKVADYYTHARDVAHLDFAGYQRNDSSHSTAAYRLQQQDEAAFHEPGRFVPLPGFEWSAFLENGGHHNVYFRRFDQPMKRWKGAASLGEEGETDLPHVRDLHNHYRGTDTLITPHVGGQHADLQWHDPQLEPALEVVSTHGTFEWFLLESISRGYRMGFVGGNDCHTGRPGDDRPGHQQRRYAKGGLTGIYAADLSLDSVLDAIRRRRCYATTGARIRADSSVEGHFMGEEFTTKKQPVFEVDAAGTAPLERIDVYRGLDLIHSEKVFPGRSHNKVRLTWSGASRMSSYSGIVWKGVVRVAGSGIGTVKPLRFDSPRSRWRKVDEHTIEFYSWACGYTSGLEIELDEPENAAVSVAFESSLIIGEKFGGHGETAPRRMALAVADSGAVTVKMSEMADEPVSLEMGHLDRRVSIERCPDPGRLDAAISVADAEPKPGFNAYWARITQLDQEVAWLSPVFVDYAGS